MAMALAERVKLDKWNMEKLDKWNTEKPDEWKKEMSWLEQNSTVNLLLCFASVFMSLFSFVWV
jgi:hypothetical protein